MSDENVQKESPAVENDGQESVVPNPLAGEDESTAIPVEHADSSKSDARDTARDTATKIDDNIVVSGTKKVLGVLLAAALYFFAFISAITGIWSGSVAAFGATSASFHPIASITLAVLSFACALFFVGVVIALFFTHKKLLK